MNALKACDVEPENVSFGEKKALNNNGQVCNIFERSDNNTYFL